MVQLYREWRSKDRSKTKTSSFSIAHSKRRLPSDDVRVIFEDREGNIWFGGYNSGISILPLGKSQIISFSEYFNLSKDQSLTDNMIRTIAQDSKGRIWIGMRYHGIAVLHDGRIRIISTADGLVNNSIWAFAEDAEGRMWVGTALAIQKISTETLQPLKQKEILIGAPVASCGVLKNGFLWYTTRDAFKVFNEESEQQEVDPPVYITRMDVNAKTISIDDGLEFPHDRNNVNFEFAGISFRGTHGLRYQYRLLGAHEQWSNPTIQHSASHLGLNPGTYTFEVRAVTEDGEMSVHPARFSFVILFPIWRTWWFIAFVIVALVLSTVSLVRARERRLLAIERLRTRIARDLHDEIGSNLTGIAMSSQLIMQKKDFTEAEKTQLNEIGNTAVLRKNLRSRRTIPTRSTQVQISGSRFLFRDLCR